MANRKIDVVSADAGPDRVERFDVSRLLDIADRYAADRRQTGEFATSWLAQKKGWTYDRAIRALMAMEADGLVTRRQAGRITLWRMTGDV